MREERFRGRKGYMERLVIKIAIGQVKVFEAAKQFEC